MKEKTLAIIIITLISLPLINHSVSALTLEKPATTFVIEQRRDNATTNNEATVGVGVHIWEYEENNPNRGDNVELRIVGSANSRQILSYWVHEDAYNWHEQLYEPHELYLGDSEVCKINLEYLVRFYGGPGSGEYDAIWVCSNGWISFYDANQSQPLPSSIIFIPYKYQANAVVAPFSRDLKPNWGGSIICGYVFHPSDYLLNDCWCLCVSWENVPDKYGNPQSFQVLIEQQPQPLQTLPRQSYIWFQYKDITLNTATTVGIEDQQGAKHTVYDYENLQNQTALMFQVASTTAYIRSISLRLIENEDSADTDIMPHEEWIRGYNVELEYQTPQPDLTKRFVMALAGAAALCLPAGGLLFSTALLAVDLVDMAATSMEIAKLIDSDWNTYATAQARSGYQGVTDAWFGIGAFWKFSDNNDVDHSLKIEVELKYYKVLSYYGDIIADNLSCKTSVDLKMITDDHNNSFDEARDNAAFETGEYAMLYLGSSDQDDYFRIHAEVGQRITVVMRPPNDPNLCADFDLFLYDKDEILRANSTTREVGVPEGIWYDASEYTGDWFIKVHWHAGQGFYSLSIEICFPGGGCPTLFAWNGSDYVDYGVINIHDLENDVVREVPISTEDVGIVGYKAKFRLREGWEGLNYSHSLIDQVKLYAVNSYGKRHLCPLIKAEHSERGNVLLQLIFSDDYRIDMYLMQTIDLTFIMPYPTETIQNFTFIIEGHNPLKN
jgi:hypothetical protein